MNTIITIYVVDIEEDPGLRTERFAIIKIRGASTNKNL